MKLSDNVKLAGVVAVAAVVLTYTYLYVTPGNSNAGFLELFVLGPNKTATVYFPDGNPNLEVDLPVRWFLSVANAHVDRREVLVKAYLGNASIGAPQPVACVPSLLPSLFDVPLSLDPNEIREVPLEWSIAAVDVQGGRVSITALQVNETLVDAGTTVAVDGINFRLIFELWTLNATTREYQFGWVQNGQHRCAWLQFWFNVTIGESGP
jgi:hypothetical protein